MTAKLPSSRVMLFLILLVSGGAIVTAMQRTSTTFDEIVMIAGGARGYETGEWNLAPEHPPFTQYLYGALPWAAGLSYPDETGVTAAMTGQMIYRYRYAQFLFWGQGNDPEQLAFLGRLPAALCALLLAALAFAFTRQHYGERAGLIAAALVAFLPDVLAHGGVAYNDLPVALAYFGALWLADRAIRAPSALHAVAAGAAIALALATKNSAVALAPALVLLLLAELVGRKGDRAWVRRILPAAGVTVLAIYLGLVLVYRGDFALAEYRYSLAFVTSQTTASQAPGYLLGKVNSGGFKYFFPLAFLYKTSLGFHALLALAIVYFGHRVRGSAQLLATPLRVPAIGALVFAALLMRSQLHIGFRYALPVLPLLAVIVAVGAARIIEADWKKLRLAALIALVWAVAHPLSYFPDFLTYVSEYGPGRKRNYEILADSSLDWGQGLLLLREYMREHQIPRVYLSYFGSAWPAGYGIDYLPLASFFALPTAANASAGAPPKLVAISATNLTGTYFVGDPFKQFRERRPIAVLGNSIYLYRVPD